MSATTLVDYTVYMTHTTLTPVRGEPSFDSLSKLETQIDENAAMSHARHLKMETQATLD